jgi:hypothetical protein
MRARSGGVAFAEEVRTAGFRLAVDPDGALAVLDTALAR